MNTGSGSQTGPSQSSPHGGFGGSGGSGGQSPPPGPAQKSGDYQPVTISGSHDKDKGEPPRKPRKDLAADQKDLRNEVRQLVRDTEELKKAVEQFGPEQSLSAELVGKTKEIEKLAHDIATLAKG
jgi:predicted RNase H-like nuclease (RuvC/YqgF family)